MVVIVGPLWLGEVLKELEISPIITSALALFIYVIVGFMISFVIPLVFTKIERSPESSA